MATLKDLRSHFLDLAGEDTLGRLGSGRIDAWLNEAQRAFSQRTAHPRKVTDQIALAQDQALYDLPADFLYLVRFEITDPIKGSLEPLPMSLVTTIRATTSRGTPSYYYLQNNQIGFWPIPGSSMSTDMYYCNYPADMVNDNDLPFDGVAYLGQFWRNLVLYAVALCFERPDMEQRGGLKRAEWFHTRASAAFQNAAITLGGMQPYVLITKVD